MKIYRLIFNLLFVISRGEVHSDYVKLYSKEGVLKPKSSLSKKFKDSFAKGIKEMQIDFNQQNENKKDAINSNSSASSASKTSFCLLKETNSGELCQIQQNTALDQHEKSSFGLMDSIASNDLSTRSSFFFNLNFLLIFIFRSCRFFIR